jgi:hypothetical protein
MRLIALVILGAASFAASAAYAQGPARPFTPGQVPTQQFIPWCGFGSFTATPYCGPVGFPVCSRSSPCRVGGQLASMCEEWRCISRIPGLVERPGLRPRPR